MISKFLDHIPVYRMENIFLRYKLEITGATLCNWTIGVYEKYFHLFDFFKNHLLSGRMLGIDETILQVHKENGRANIFFIFLNQNTFYSTKISRDRD